VLHLPGEVVAEGLDQHQIAGFGDEDDREFGIGGGLYV
jgi:hypothetical protein